MRNSILAVRARGLFAAGCRRGVYRFSAMLLAFMGLVATSTVSNAQPWTCPLVSSYVANVTTNIVSPTSEAVYSATPSWLGHSATVDLKSAASYWTSADQFLGPNCLAQSIKNGGYFIVKGPSIGNGQIKVQANYANGYLTAQTALGAGRYSVSVVGTTNLYGTGDVAMPGSGQQIFFTVNQAPPPPGPVDGVIDFAGVSGDQFVVNGWACDKNVASSIRLDVYLGGPAGAGSLVISTYANIPNESPVDERCGTVGVGHRFQIVTPMSVTSQYPRAPVYIYGISASGGGNPLIGSFTLP